MTARLGRTWKFGVLASAVALLLAGCRSNTDTASSAASAGPTVSFSAAPAVTGTTVKLTLASAGITLTDADGDTSGHSGHYVIFVDQQPPAPGHAIATAAAAEADGIYHTSSSSLNIRGQSPGTHTYVAALADGNNDRLGDVLAQTTATIQPPGVTLFVAQNTAACQGPLLSVTPEGFSLPNVAQPPAVLDNSGAATVPTTAATTTTAPPAGSVIDLTTTTTTVPPNTGSSTTAAPTTTAPPPPPDQITYYLDRPPRPGPASSSDFGTVTAPSLSLCVTGLAAGHHSVWVVTVDATGTPLQSPIEGVITFDTTA